MNKSKVSFKFSQKKFELKYSQKGFLKFSKLFKNEYETIKHQMKNSCEVDEEKNKVLKSSVWTLNCKNIETLK